jgi:hypothetical protein
MIRLMLKHLIMMVNKVIKTEEEYNLALVRLEEIFDVCKNSCRKIW